MENRNKKTSNLDTRGRKFRKFLLWAFILITLIFIAGFISIRIFFPVEKVKLMISEKLSTALERPVSIEKVSLNPLKGFDVRSLSIDFSKEEGEREGVFFKANRLAVQYKLLSLLRRRLDITGILIAEPQLHVVSLPIKKEEIYPEKQVEAVAETTEALSPLPLSFGLFRLFLNDFRLTLTIPDSSGEKEIILNGLNLEASGLRLPRNYYSNPNGIRGKIRLFTKKGELSIQASEIELQLKTEVNFTCEWYKKAKWNINGDIGLSSLSSDIESGVNVSLGVDGIGYGETVNLEKTDIFIGKQKIFHVEGKLNNIGSDNTEIDLTVGGDDLNIKEIVLTLKQIVPAQLFKPLESMEIQGSLSLGKGRVWGKSGKYKFQYSSGLKGGELENQSVGFNANGAGFGIMTEGIWANNRLENGKVEGNLNLKKCRYEMNDSVEVSIENISLKIQSGLDSAFVPTNGFINGEVDKILGGYLGLDIRWDIEAESEKILDDIIVNGKIHCDTLSLESFPNMSPGVSGKIDLTFDLGTRGLKDIRINFTGHSDSLLYEADGGIEKTPAFNLISDMVLRIDPKLKILVLDSAIVRLNNIFTGNITGKFIQSEQKFNLSLIESQIRNREIPNLLPENIKDQLKGIAFRGREEIQVDVLGAQTGDSTELSVNGKLSIVDAGISYPVQNVKIRDINGEMQLSGSIEKLSGNVDILVGRTLFEKLRPEPIENSQLNFSWKMIPGDSIWIESGRITVRPLGLWGGFFAGVSQQKEFQRMAFGMEIAFRSKDSIELAQGMMAQGSLIFRLSGKTIDPEKQWIMIKGEVDIDSLDLIKEKSLIVRKIKGEIPFHLNADLLKQNLLPSTTARPISWAEYESQRILYRNRLPWVKNISIEELRVVDYQMSDLVLDLNVGSGFFQIPWFSINLFEGNLGGSLLLDLGKGTMNDITYAIRGQVSRINSAALISGRTKGEEETELNASLAFRGKGIDIDKGIDVEGFFHITKIGPKFASTLLKGMDPQGSDRSIRLTRKLLNTGWKPKLFSFELRHGYVYPSLALSQPWFSPIRIPGQLEYGRLPIEFFLKPH